MFIDVNKIGPGGVGFDEPLKLDLPRPADDERVKVVEARLRGAAVPGTRGVELAAHLEARVTLQCSRCLRSFEMPIASDFALTIVLEEPPAPPGETETEVDERDIDLFAAADGRVDLATITREQIYLNLPLKPLCSTRCAGLCPTCGVDRNRIECDCVAEAVDPRLAPLLDFKRRTEGSDGGSSGPAGNRGGN